MRGCITIFSAAFLCAMLTPRAARATPAGVGSLVWSDSFAGTTLNSTNWSVNQPGAWDGGSNGGFTNSSLAVGVNNGLKITTYTDTATGNNFSAVLGTQGKRTFTYGYFEARIQFNGAPGAWSAFWLQSPTVGTPLGNPGVAGTEIDVAEYRVIDDAAADVSHGLNSAIHWDGYGANHQAVQKFNNSLAGLNNSTWHTYGLLWTSAAYTFYLDDSPIWTTTTSISNAPEYLLLSTEVQDNFWAGNIPVGGYGTPATSTTSLNVAYVNVYAVPEPATLALLLPTLCLLGRPRRGRTSATRLKACAAIVR